ARSASPPPVGSTGLVSGTAITEIGSAGGRRNRVPPGGGRRVPRGPRGGGRGARWTTQAPVGGPGGHQGPHPEEHLVLVPAGLLLEQVGLVLVGEQHVGAVDEPADHLAVGPGPLLAGGGRGP